MLSTDRYAGEIALGKNKKGQEARKKEKDCQEENEAQGCAST
jgi:hypothetical protein